MLSYSSLRFLLHLTLFELQMFSPRPLDSTTIEHLTIKHLENSTPQSASQSADRSCTLGSENSRAAEAVQKHVTDAASEITSEFEGKVAMGKEKLIVS